MTSTLVTREAPATAGASGPCRTSCARRTCSPSTYSLSAAELRAEIRRCHAAGWQLWEIACRLAHPKTLERSA